MNGCLLEGVNTVGAAVVEPVVAMEAVVFEYVGSIDVGVINEELGSGMITEAAGADSFALAKVTDRGLNKYNVRDFEWLSGAGATSAKTAEEEEDEDALEDSSSCSCLIEFQR